jgi:hypothetical protein
MYKIRERISRGEKEPSPNFTIPAQERVSIKINI